MSYGGTQQQQHRTLPNQNQPQVGGGGGGGMSTGQPSATASASVNQIILNNSRDSNIYDRLISAKTPKRAIRLQPLQLDRVKTPGMMSVDNENLGEVRGTRLQTSVDRLTPQLSALRNNMLPPLERVETADNLKERRHSPKQRASNRSASAATHDIDTPVLRERTLTFLPDSRPNTTHAFHTELLLAATRGRLSTPQTPSNSKLREGALFGAQLGAQSRLNPAQHSIHQISEYPVGRASTSTSKQVSASGEQAGGGGGGGGGKSVSFGEDQPPEEFDDFVLWGRGPPIISHQKVDKKKSSKPANR